MDNESVLTPDHPLAPRNLGKEPSGDGAAQEREHRNNRTGQPEAIGLIGQHGHIARQPGSIGRIKALTGVHQHHQKTRDDADIVNEYDSLLIHVVSCINCIKIHYLADLAKYEPMRPLLSSAAASEKRLECWLPRWEDGAGPIKVH